MTATVKDATLLKQTQWVASGGTLANATGLTAYWTAPDNTQTAADFTLTLKATQTNGLIDLQNVTLHVLPSNQNSTGARITGITTSASTVKPNDVITATVAVASQADVLDVQWAANKGQLVSTTGYSVQWVAPSVFAGTDTALLTVTTTGKNQDVHTAQVQLSGSGVVSPVITKISANPATVTAGSASQVQVTPADPTNVSSITWSADGGTLANRVGDTTSWVAPEVRNTTVFTITATVIDKRGATSTATVQIVDQPRAG